MKKIANWGLFYLFCWTFIKLRILTRNLRHGIRLKCVFLDCSPKNVKYSTRKWGRGGGGGRGVDIQTVEQRILLIWRCWREIDCFFIVTFRHWCSNILTAALNRCNKGDWLYRILRFNLNDVIEEFSKTPQIL